LAGQVVGRIGQTGLVGVIHGRKTRPGRGKKVIGLRADMDALPIEEATAYPISRPSRARCNAWVTTSHCDALGAAK